jgi:predicted transcriptional regulator
MSKTLKITVQLSEDLDKSIADLSATSGAPIEAITEDALKHYVDWRAAQLSDLKEAIAAADRGEFATDDEVKALFARHGA